MLPNLMLLRCRVTHLTPKSQKTAVGEIHNRSRGKNIKKLNNKQEEAIETVRPIQSPLKLSLPDDKYLRLCNTDTPSLILNYLLLHSAESIASVLSSRITVRQSEL